MTGNEIRQTFLRYFEERGHTRVRSSPLLPANDPTLLFTNAGMNQFKDVFLGLEKRDYVRASSAQKCVRAGGKHNDLDEVGKTARHQTFFEMMGNFSFGDYFKREAIQYAWDFLTGSRDEGKLGLDPERLWFTVFGGDDEVPADEEAAALWIEVGARPERVLRFGRKDNFWQMAETGPCGPTSEINYYLGEHPDDPEFNRADLVNGPGDTTMEIWNLVFMQYNRVEVELGKYKLELLPKPSVDTGLGLERTAVILQGKFSNYDTDLLRPIVDFTATLAGRAYEPETQEGFAMRVIADHARATAFLIADGILPGNEGRNYVLRKIMRRAIYQGRHALEFKDEFFYKVTDFVVDQMHEPYPELKAQRDFIEKMVKLEEERFGSTLMVGLNKLDELIRASRDLKTGEVVVPTLELARLYDTFGTPIDLMYVVLSQGNYKLVHRIRPFDYEEFRPVYFVLGIESVTEEDFGKGIEKLTEENFRNKIEVQLKDLQKGAIAKQTAGSKKLQPVYVALARRHDTKSRFRGYETARVDGAKVIALIRGDLVSTAYGSGRVDDPNPPATAGGTDKNATASRELLAAVLDTYSPAQGLIVHKVKIEKGTLEVGDTVVAEVDVEKRDATRRNHTDARQASRFGSGAQLFAIRLHPLPALDRKRNRRDRAAGQLSHSAQRAGPNRRDGS